MGTSRIRDLTRNHSSAQLDIADRQVAELAEIWPTAFDPEDIKRSVVRLTRDLEELIGEGRERSTDRAAQYIKDVREREFVREHGPIRREERIDKRRLERLLTYSVAITPARSLRMGREYERAARDALVQTGGVITREVMAGGRQTIHKTIKDDPVAKGYRRVLKSAEPCEFCIMLATRGPAYSKDTAYFEAHTACRCSAEPVYSKWEPDQREQELIEQFEEAGSFEDFRQMHRSDRHGRNGN